MTRLYSEIPQRYLNRGRFHGHPNRLDLSLQWACEALGLITQIESLLGKDTDEYTISVIESSVESRSKIVKEPVLYKIIVVSDKPELIHLLRLSL